MKKLEGDKDEEFLKDGVINGFLLNPADVVYEPAEMENYRSFIDDSVRYKVE